MRRAFIAYAVFVAAFAFACPREAPATARAPSPDRALPEALSAVEGEYMWNGPSKRYVYSRKDALEKIVSARSPEDALRQLVGCLDDLSPSRSKLDGKNVALGVVCYEALSQLAYHEETTPTGDIASNWVGHLLPTATARDLRAAKSAWELVLRKKDYRFL